MTTRLRDLRNLPVPVVERLQKLDAWDDYGRRHRGVLVEAGHDLRARPAGQRLEVRADDDAGDQPVLDGYATVYDAPYDVAGGPPFGWTETIVAGAAKKSVDERDDVYLLFDHDGLPLASTKAGTLTLDSDSVGLLTIARPDMRSAWNSEIVGRVQARELDAMSFAFTVTRQEWNDDYTERFVTELRLWDVAVVKWPANPAAHIHARQQVRAAGAMPLSLAAATADRLRLARR